MPARGFLVFDIETVPDPELYKPPEPTGVPGIGLDKPFPPLWAHKPIVLGVLWLDEQYNFKRLGVIGEDKDEGGMLADFATFADTYRPHLVTYNGRSFDLPVIALRCLRHGLPMRFFFADRDYRYRFSDTGHIDLYDFLSEHGAARIGSLDAVARLMGLPGKVGVDGSQVEGLYATGQLDLIKKYCLSDVAQTAFLFLRYRLLQGIIDGPGYRAAASRLFDALQADGRVGSVIERIDRSRLLLS
jgi:predicted PolB exonuclease-like 3'-5' exonuclease